MNLLAAVLSGVAATIAAVFAGLNLYLSGRRDNAKWARDTLTDTFGAFLDASFRAKDSVKTAIQISRSDVGQDKIAERRREAVAIEGEMQQLQTRLRLLTSAEVVESAQALRTGIKEYISLVGATDKVSPQADQEQRRRLWSLRESFVVAAKRSLSL